jgi:SAM-dependent methyltransferase
MESCSLCRHYELSILFDRDFRVFLCRNCGLVFIGNKDRDYRKYYTHEYNYAKDTDGCFLENKKADDSIFEWVMSNLDEKAGLSLLEIGCNAGFLLKRLQDSGLGVFGVEPGIESAAYARRLVGENRITCGMLEDITMEKQAFDVVLLVQTFEHFTDPLQSLLKIKSTLKDGALLFIEVPNFYAPDGFYKFRVHGVNYPSPNHLFVYTPKTLSAFLSKAGFSVHKQSYTFGSVRMIARADGNGKAVEFDNYYRIMIFFRLLPVLSGCFKLARFCKRELFSYLK